MNERIKELAEQAEKECAGIDKNYAWEWEKKFAELIVLKCADLCTDQYYTDGGGFGITTADMRCAELIKKHFGVE